ncbi:SusC/RagA family TonB-linked outer membrane protein, partial [Fodinibius sp.]|uniref:SusC/RagA family TonB-linked outer membrane protein n=1 Tax=Fodinibius sp. TaxID=1872440 RepID=UPI0035634AAF
LAKEVEVGFSFQEYAIPDKKVTASFSEVPIYEALYRLLEGTGLEVTLSPDRDILVIREKLYQEFKIQQETVTGTVTDAQSGETLPGVNVIIKGTTTGTSTNSDGQYELDVPSLQDTLVFSFVGYQTQEAPMGGRTTVDVALQSQAIQGEEMVVVGYGALERGQVSTSIASVKTEGIADQVTSSIDRSLEGQVAGLTVQQASGAPGGGSIMRIRGSGSIGAGDEPLVVIDGVPIQNSYGQYQSPLSLINQSDIASIDVLKGVSATAIYGSRGSNGVILVETKSGTSGQTQLSFNASSGIQYQLPSEKLNLLSAEEFARWRQENAFEEAEFYGNEIDMSDIAEEYRNPEELGEGVDWNKHMTRNAPVQNYNLSVSHGTEKFQGFFSLGYTDEQGAVEETSFDRISMRANLDYQANDYFEVGVNITPVIRNWGNRATGTRTFPFGLANTLSPLDGPYQDEGPFEDGPYDGKWDLNITSDGMFNNGNPLYALKNRTDKTRQTDLYLQPHLQFNIWENFSFRSQLNMQYGQSYNEYFKPSTVTGMFNSPPVAIDGSYSTGRSFNWQFENTLNYEHTFDEHTFSGILGYTREHYNGQSSYQEGSGFPGDDVRTLNAATEMSGNTFESNWSMISYMARLSYDFQEKYLFTGTVRRDGSSRFGTENRWGNFPSVSVGWVITQEDFFPDSELITNLKLRASYGTSGNNNIGNYTHIPTVNENNYTFGGTVVSGRIPTALGNPNLSWERSTEINTGFDLELREGRFSIVADYYRRVTNNMLWPVDIPISSGFSSIMQNVGEVENRGLELAVNTLNITNNNFNWETDFNISFNRNKVLDLGNVDRIREGHRGMSITRAGDPMALFYGWQHLGIFNTQEEVDENPSYPNQLPGTPIVHDEDGNGTINELDKVIIGNPHPDFRGGISNSFNYKNFDLNIAMSFAHNFDVNAILEEDVLNLDGVFNVLEDVKNRWRSPEEPGNGHVAASFHQTSFDRFANSDWIYNVSYLKVQNLSLGYTFNNFDFVNRFRIYGSIQNLMTITGYKYGNPDVNLEGSSSLAKGYDSHDYPLTRSVVLGINLNF